MNHLQIRRESVAAVTRHCHNSVSHTANIDENEGTALCWVFLPANLYNMHTDRHTDTHSAYTYAHNRHTYTTDIEGLQRRWMNVNIANLLPDNEYGFGDDRRDDIGGLI